MNGPDQARDKKTLAIASFLLFVVAQFWPPVARIAGLMPFTGGALTGILFVNAIAVGVGLIEAAIGGQSMMADAADEHEHRFGVRREGLLLAHGRCRSLTPPIARIELNLRVSR